LKQVALREERLRPSNGPTDFLKIALVEGRVRNRDRSTT